MQSKILNLVNKFTKPQSKKSVGLAWEDFYLVRQELRDLPAQELYRQNVIVYRCVNLISSSASHVPWIILSKKDDGFIKDGRHPANRLLNHPCPSKCGADFFAQLITNLLIYGNAYVLSIGADEGQPAELHILPADKVDIINHKATPTHYRYTSNGASKYYPIDKVSGLSQVLHLKTCHITEKDTSNLDAARMPISLHMQATKWNNALLQNGARPSGAFVFTNHDEYLTDEQFERLQEQINAKMSGYNNSGRPIILEAGLEWREMSISPKDMDFIESKNSAAREIALAFGVPPQLLGINGDNTYSNMQEARLALWEETILPLLDKLSDNFTLWLSFLYNHDVMVDFDRDAISALRQKRENLWAQVSQTNFMTINEKRAFFGLKPLQNGDDLAKN